MKHYLLLILAAPLAGAAIAAPVGCEKLFESSANMAKQPYRVTQTMTVDGKPMTSEAVYKDGVMYIRSPEMAGGKWRASRIDLAGLTKMAQETTLRCTPGGTELVGTISTRVWTTQTQLTFGDKQVVEGKTWVGLVDGRVHRAVTQGMDQRIFYDNVVVPDVAIPADKKKR